MVKAKKCPECGTELAVESTGPCPKCALAVGLESVAAMAEDRTVDVFPAEERSVDVLETPGPGESSRYFGDYELIEEIARGGMGVVYKARQASLNRTVAVKMILAGQLAGRDEVQRFHGEAQAAANLLHPNIVAIHEVGEHEGQHYFSMDYVDGQSLAEVLREHPLSATQAATYVKTIAEAIAYAHEKGILHRDLKPSNILVDRDAQLHITDFGLAKQLHRESEMTATGQAMGTPSYMPPEQAAGQKSEIGPGSDVYSIGAILYELLTGRPPFRAETPLDTLMQVLENEPAAPRLIHPGIPKDLETICLKCLEKETDRRYSSSSELADDLTRFLNDESIHARPVGLAERSRRLLRKQRRSVALSAIAVISTVMLGLFSLVGWYSYRQWMLGYIHVLTDRASITTELVGESGELAVPPFTVPTGDPVAVPAGDYQLRASSDGRLSQDYRINVLRGIEPKEYRLNLEDQLLWPTINVPRAFELVDIEGSADVILIDDRGIRRLRGLDGKTVVWELNLDNETRDPTLREAGPFRWLWNDLAADGKSAFQPPQIIKPALDLDGDGVRDLVLAARHQAWLLAASGKTGKVIWFAGRGADLKAASLSDPTSTVVGIPMPVGDLNHDGVPELVATFADFTSQSKQSDAPRRWIETISGSTGHALWTYELDNRWFELPAGQEVPEHHRWFVEVDDVKDERTTATTHREDIARFDQGFKREGKWRHVPHAARAGKIEGQHVIIEISGTRLITLDAATGKHRRPPFDLGFVPIQAPIVADVDGDSSTDVVLVESVRKTQWTTSPGQFRVVVWSLSNNQPVCETTLSGYWSRMAAPTTESSGWPRVVDLNGDSQQELLVPNGTTIGRVSARITPSSGSLEALDGTTGEVLWSRKLLSMDQQLNHFMTGKDINGDGYRDVFVATLVRKNYDLYVDALSGADGSKLWWSRHRLEREDVWLGQLRWWHASSDGWPQLLVPVTHGDRDWTTAALYAFSSGTGQLQQTGMGIEEADFADANGDGLSDLFAFQPTRTDDPDAGGKLNCIQAEPPESWRRIGSGWVVGQDYDQDGVDDLLCGVKRTVSAFSGCDGNKLWDRTLGGELERTPISLAWDVSGDGIPDVLCADLRRGNFLGPGNLPLELLSGSDGRVLWSSDIKIRASDGFLYIDCRQLDGRGSPELVIAVSTDWGYPWRRSIGSPSSSTRWLSLRATAAT